jgi:hypothetical protein
VTSRKVAPGLASANRRGEPIGRAYEQTKGLPDDDRNNDRNCYHPIVGTQSVCLYVCFAVCLSVCLSAFSVLFFGCPFCCSMFRLISLVSRPVCLWRVFLFVLLCVLLHRVFLLSVCVCCPFVCSVLRLAFPFSVSLSYCFFCVCHVDLVQSGFAHDCFSRCGQHVYSVIFTSHCLSVCLPVCLSVCLHTNLHLFHILFTFNVACVLYCSLVYASVCVCGKPSPSCV